MMASRIVKILVGVAVCSVASAPAFGQRGDAGLNQTTRIDQPFTGVGLLTYPGIVGWGPSQQVGLVGGVLSNPQSTRFEAFRAGAGLPIEQRGRPNATLPGLSAGFNRGEPTGFGRTLDRRTGLGAGFGASLGQTPLAVTDDYSVRQRRVAAPGVSAFNYNPLTSVERPYTPYGYSPSQIMLDRKQLLRADSRLGRLATGPRDAFSMRKMVTSSRPPVGGRTAGASDPDAEVEVKSPLPSQEATLPAEQRFLLDRARRMKNYMDRGDELLRAGEYPAAKDSYDVAAAANRDSAAPLARLYLVSLYMGNLGQASVFARHAMVRARQLDDLKIDLPAVSPKADPFGVLVQRLGDLAARSDASEGIQLLYAYSSWLNGDVSTARRIAETLKNKEVNIRGIEQFEALLAGRELPSRS